MSSRIETPCQRGGNDGVAGDAGECLLDDEIMAFAEGRLDPAQLGRVHAHADQCELCQELLSQAVHALGPGLGVEGHPFGTMLRSEETVSGRYKIQRFVASGGMGEVYEAFDAELQARVALKTVKSTASDDPAAVRRLKTEVQLAHRVSHPNVCRIFDFGSHEAERDRAVVHYLTMEFVEGRNLGELLRSEGALPIEKAVAVARELALGLGAAHSAGVLHRDFKSDNVMVRGLEDGRVGAVILDFGLARCLDANRKSYATARGPALLGTLKYMAPEQIEGKTLCARTDVYALGMVIFEMLTGSVAFPSANAPAHALFERLHRPPPAPSSRNADVSPSLDAIVTRCLARAPGERYASALDVLAALDEVERRRAYRRRLSPGTPRWLPWLLAAGVVASAVVLRPALPWPKHGASTARAAPRRPAVTPSRRPVAPEPPASAPLEAKSITNRDAPPPSPSPSARARTRSARPQRLVVSSAAPIATAAGSVTAPPPHAEEAAAPTAQGQRPIAAPTPVAMPAMPGSAVAPISAARLAKPDWENPFARRPARAAPTER